MIQAQRPVSSTAIRVSSFRLGRIVLRGDLAFLSIYWSYTAVSTMGTLS
jgi:hypothetical protein